MLVFPLFSLRPRKQGELIFLHLGVFCKCECQLIFQHMLSWKLPSRGHQGARQTARIQTLRRKGPLLYIVSACVCRGGRKSLLPYNLSWIRIKDLCRTNTHLKTPRPHYELLNLCFWCYLPLSWIAFFATNSPISEVISHVVSVGSYISLRHKHYAKPLLYLSHSSHTCQKAWECIISSQI